MIWISSDTHFSHKNILQYCNRPFSSVEEMDETIINRYNEHILSNDTFYFLGDFVFSRRGKVEDVYSYAERLNCKKIHFVLGNHDKLIRKHRDQLLRDRVFLSIEDVIYLRDTSPSIFMSHYAHKVWPSSHYGVYHLYGHSHNNLPDDPNSFSFDVGVDTNDFYPYSLPSVVDKMSVKTFTSIDHHGRDEGDVCL